MESTKHNLTGLRVTGILLLALACSGCHKPMTYHFKHYHTPFRAIADSNKTYFQSPLTGRVIPKDPCAVYAEPGCFGYEPTCWSKWPSECPATCPIDDGAALLLGAPVVHRLSDEGVVSEEEELEPNQPSPAETIESPPSVMLPEDSFSTEQAPDIDEGGLPVEPDAVPIEPEASLPLQDSEPALPPVTPNPQSSFHTPFKEPWSPVAVDEESNVSSPSDVTSKLKRLRETKVISIPAPPPSKLQPVQPIERSIPKPVTAKPRPTPAPIFQGVSATEGVATKIQPPRGFRRNRIRTIQRKPNRQPSSRLQSSRASKDQSADPTAPRLGHSIATLDAEAGVRLLADLFTEGSRSIAASLSSMDLSGHTQEMQRVDVVLPAARAEALAKTALQTSAEQTPGEPATVISSDAAIPLDELPSSPASKTPQPVKLRFAGEPTGTASAIDDNASTSIRFRGR